MSLQTCALSSMDLGTAFTDSTNFGNGLQETPHYKVWPGFIPSLTALSLYVDRRDPANSRGMEVDNITVTTQPAVKIRPSEMEICWYAEGNATYRVDYQSNLTGTNWLPLIECVQGTGAPMLIYDKIPSSESQRFYRITETNCVPIP